MKFAAAMVVISILIIGVVMLLSSNDQTKPATPATLNDLVGKPSPDFSLKSYDGKDFTLSQLKGRKVVLFFNEGIICYPACWNQIAALGTDSRFNNDKVTSLSIVPDGANDWQEATKKMPELSKGVILLDETKEVSEKYGMLSLVSSMHKGQKPGHTYVVIDQNGIVRDTLDDPTMGIQNEELINKLNKI